MLLTLGSDGTLTGRCISGGGCGDPLGEPPGEPQGLSLGEGEAEGPADDEAEAEAEAAETLTAGTEELIWGLLEAERAELRSVGVIDVAAARSQRVGGVQGVSDERGIERGRWSERSRHTHAPSEWLMDGWQRGAWPCAALVLCSRGGLPPWLLCASGAQHSAQRTNDAVGAATADEAQRERRIAFPTLDPRNRPPVPPFAAARRLPSTDCSCNLATDPTALSCAALFPTGDESRAASRVSASTRRRRRAVVLQEGLH